MFFVVFLSNTIKNEKNKSEKGFQVGQKNILCQCAKFLGRPDLLWLFLSYFFFLSSLYFSYSFTYTFIFPEDLVLAEERTTEKDRKRIMEGKSLSFLQQYFYILYIFLDNVEEQWQVQKTELLFILKKSKDIN